MTNDLIARAKDYLAKTEEITEEPKFWETRFEEERNFLEDSDFTAITLTPTARALIQELVKEVESLKKHGSECVEKYSDILKEMEVFITGTGMWFTSHPEHCQYLKTISEIFNSEKTNG